MAAGWGWGVSTIGTDISILGVGATTPVKLTLGDCAAVIILGTLGGSGVGGIQLFGVGGMQALHRFPQSLIFGFGRGITVVTWYGSYRCLKISQISIIYLHCESHVIAGQE